MPTDQHDYVSKQDVQLYVPVPFATTSIQVGGGSSSGGGSGTGSGGGSTDASALYFSASCQASDAVGCWVRVTDSQDGVTTTDSGHSYPAVGILVAKPTATTCTVQTYGLCKGVVSGLTPNVRLFVGPDGKSAAGSSLPATTAYLQPVAFSVQPGTIFVQPSGTLYRRDAQAASDDPAPAAGGDSTQTYPGLLYGTGAPSAELGSEGSAYLATDSLLFFTRGADGWDAGRSLVGSQGESGKDGASTLTGTGAPPDALGNDGDTYIALDADGQAVTFYGQKANGQWPTTGTSLIGPAGADAPPGPTITGGDGAPDPANVGIVGSLYLDRTNIDLYQAQA